jgi:para-aminobenzoate synthetase component 1
MEKTILPVSDVSLFKQKALSWACKFEVCCLLNSNERYTNLATETQWTLAVDVLDKVQPEPGSCFSDLKTFLATKQQTVFGFLSYELKNEVESLSSKNPDFLGFPPLFFFEPRYLIEVFHDKVVINRNYPEAFALVEAIEKINLEQTPSSSLHFNFRTDENNYCQQVENIKQKIVDGDFYEMNYCIEAYAEQVEVHADIVYHRLNENTQAPFSCFFKWGQKYLICASPERFLKKHGKKIYAQPIKGTIAKSADVFENKALKEKLKNSEKDRAENVMIVDLMRNDLAKSCKTGSIVVEELCEVYEFKTVHQMISTVSGVCQDEVHLTDILKNAFPMGSMTGAPKVEVMKNIDELENFSRNLFSGSVGYITPEGNFDFNVVIRSIFYDAHTRYLSLRAGSAITFDSDALGEWQEVLLKMKALREIFEK